MSSQKPPTLMVEKAPSLWGCDDEWVLHPEKSRSAVQLPTKVGLKAGPPHPCHTERSGGALDPTGVQ